MVSLLFNYNVLRRLCSLMGPRADARVYLGMYSPSLFITSAMRRVEMLPYRLWQSGVHQE